jgi:hypothetical protein
VIMLLLAMTLMVAVSGCRTSGSREFIPDRGWVPTR